MLGCLHYVFFAESFSDARAYGILEVRHQVLVSHVEEALQVLGVVELLRDVFPVHEVDSCRQNVVGELFNLHHLVLLFPNIGGESLLEEL